MSKTVQHVIDFLGSCGVADIEAGIGALLGNATTEKQREFLRGLEEAIQKDSEMACPFCGGHAMMEKDRPDMWMQCLACGAQGPPANTEEKARAKWNERSSTCK